MIVLDTHIWIWWVNGDQSQLGSSRINLIQSADLVSVSAISCFEVAWLNAHGRIELPFDKFKWFTLALGGSGVELLPITPEIAGIAVDLPEHHSDPQDRIIIATAIKHGAHLMSLDKKFPGYQEIRDALL